MGMPQRNLSLVFAAGSVGGLANSLAVWGSGKLGISGALGIALTPDWTPAWLYPRIVWGGIWGALFLLPVLKSSTIKRGILFSFGPTIFVLVVVLPYWLNKGMFGMELGNMIPLFAFVVNAIWGIAAAWWLKQCQTAVNL